MIQPRSLKKKLLAPYFRPLGGVWYRGINLKYVGTALQFSHSSAITSRFHHAKHFSSTYPLLYLTESPDTALLEVNAVLSPPGSELSIANPHSAWAVLNVEIALKAILDLTDTKVESLLQTNFQELTGDWQGYDLRSKPGASIKRGAQAAPTQELELALYRIPGLLGFLTVSAKAPARKNLVVFPDKIKTPADGKIEFTDPATGIVHQIP
jgi:hypothetical protein